MRQFTQLDGADDPRWFIDFMDAANQLPGYDVVNRRMAKVIHPKPSMRILDLGTGTGDDARQFLDLARHH